MGEAVPVAAILLTVCFTIQQALYSDYFSIDVSSVQTINFPSSDVSTGWGLTTVLSFLL